jgi:phage terminase large subunit
VTFKFTAKQTEAQQVLAGEATHIMLFGGGRSGKTFLNIRNIILRAIKAPGSRHLIVRFRFNHLKASIILETFPKVMALCFPDIRYELSKTDWYVTLPNGSEIWFGGLDDKDRTEKLLG